MNKTHYRLKKRLYRLKSIRRRRGFGIHSPFVFHLVTKVIGGKLHDVVIEEMKDIRKQTIEYLKREEKVDGVGIDIGRKLKQEIKRLKKEVSVDKLIFRLMNFIQPKSPIFVGDEIGISVGYMAKVDERVPLHWLRTDIELTAYQRFVLDKLNAENIIREENICIDTFSEIDFLVLSDSTSKQILQQFTANIEQALSENSFVMIKNIHRNEALRELWLEWKEMEIFTYSLDLFQIGILIRRKGMRRHNYVLKYRF